MMPQPAVAPLPRETLETPLREASERALATRGDDTFLRVMAHAPELLQWYGDFYQKVFYGGRVAVRYKELLRLRLSTVHGCAFCNKGNRLDALAAGLTETQLKSIADESAACWSPAESAVLHLAANMALTNPDGHLDAALHARLQAYFDAPQIVELGMTMAVLTGMAKFLFVYDLVEREPYCEFGAPG
jgi:hypothetical protein